MALTKRLLRVMLEMPDGTTVTWDENLWLQVRVRKACLAIQAMATVDVAGITQERRKGLLTQFTAYKKRQRETEGLQDDSYVNVTISAGMRVGKVDQLTEIFHGQVASATPVSAPPNALIRLVCYTNQIDKTKYTTSVPPAQSTLKQFVIWAAGQMGLAYDIQTSYDDMLIENPGRTTFVVSALLPEIQRIDRQNIIAYIDDKTLIVRDTNKLLSPTEVYDINTFLGQPLWTEWGIDFSILFDPRIRLAVGVKLASITNPSLGEADMIVMDIDYDLASRANQFNMKVATAPAA